MSSKTFSGVYLWGVVPFLLFFILLPGQFTGWLLVGTFAFAIYRGFNPASEQSAAKIKTLPRSELTLSALREKRADITNSLEGLAKLRVFGGGGETLREAWDKKDIEQLDRILKEADADNRRGLQSAANFYNRAIAPIDLARGKLKALIADSETALKPYAINFNGLSIAESPELEALTPVTRRKEFVTEKLNISQGVGNALGRAASGNVPWQIALPVAGGIVLWHLVNRSKMLRQLREMQGVIEVNAEKARGDFKTFRDVISMRVLPQFDSAICVIENLEEGLRELISASPEENTAPNSKDAAFRLACSLVEAKRLLAKTGGN